MTTNTEGAMTTNDTRGYYAAGFDTPLLDGSEPETQRPSLAVDGKIVVADADRLEVKVVIDLAEFHNERAVLGWCRGILLDGTGSGWASPAIRPTRFRENVRGWRTDSAMRNRRGLRATT